MGLGRAAVRLVEEQQALAAVRRQPGQPQQPAAHLPAWQAPAQMAAFRQGPGLLPPAWQPAATNGAQQPMPPPPLSQQQHHQLLHEPQRAAEQQGAQNGRQQAGQLGADSYEDFLTVALQLLQDTGEQWLAKWRNNQPGFQ